MAKEVSLAGQEVADFLKDVCRDLQKKAHEKVKPIESELRQASFDVKSRIELGIPQFKILEVELEENVSVIILGSQVLT